MESEFAEDVIKSIEDDVQKLIRTFTPYEPTCDDFKQCVEFTLYNILCKKHSIPSQTTTRELLDTFILRYNCEGFSKYAGIFENSLNDYLTNDSTNQKVKWNVLECLVQLSEHPFRTDVLENLKERLSACNGITFPEESPEEEEEEKIDWHAILQEGSEKYRLPSDDSDENSSYDSDAEEKKTVIAEPMPEENVTTAPVYNDLFSHFPQDPVIVLDQNMILKKLLQDEFTAKEWLSDNSQHSWWKGEPHKIDVGRQPASSFGLRWEENISSKNSQFVEEYKILRELLWVFVIDDEIVRNKRIEYLREKAAITSLIQSTSKSIVDEILDSAIGYFSLRVFYEEILLGDNVLRLAFSFRAYATVLKDFCFNVLQKVVLEEKNVKEQGETYTLLMLHSSLKPYLDDMNFFCKVHRDCMLAKWSEKEESWFCIVRLLSQIFYKLQETVSAHHRKILLRIFFKTFKVYADMIDGWLTENRLSDWRNEFFIKKNVDGDGYKSFLDDATSTEEIIVAPFFTHISERMLNCNQNVEFLCKLNKMQSVKSEIFKEGSLMDSIIREFLRRSHQHQIECLNIDDLCIEHVEDPEVNTIFEKGDVLEEFVENVYLIQAYRDAFQTDNFVEKKTLEDRHDENNWEERLTGLDLLPVANILEQAICSVIEKKETVIAKFFELAIVEDYKFFDHIRTLTGLLLVDMKSFCDRMNLMVEKKTWAGNHALQILLCNSVQSSRLPFGESLHFVFDKNTVIADRQSTVCISDIIKTVDCITLKYSTEWPMSKIFTDDIIECVYNPLFKLVLKLNIAFFSVTRLRFCDLPNTRAWRRKLRKVEVFRHWVAILLQKLRSYMMLIVPERLGDKLIESISEINNFTSLQQNYSAYLEKAKPKCLINPKMLEYLNRALERMWRVCDDVRDLWMKATLQHLNDQHVARSIELYVQCVWYLSQILKKFTKEKRADSPLYNLWSDVQHMVKVHEQSIPEDLSFKSNQPTLI